MIREHAFNTAWWGRKVGIVGDASFFALPEAEQERALSEFAWVEFVAPFGSSLPLHQLRRAGFVQVDTQVRFRIALQQVPSLPGSEELTVESAGRQPFAVEAVDLAPFQHERFKHLPGISEEKLAARYAVWSNALVARQPDWCLRILLGSAVQGWFLSEAGGDSFELTLAMLHREARISGLLLYQMALQAYAERGRRVGAARFSVENSAVHNIYARLGARFLSPLGCWLWLPRGASPD